ncbi:MAG: dienelactone hydrolase family protein [Alphaproteobacteria bacterium]|nr:dienelactone hydrolase family protein [Alphaproteobacteria bacterium]MBU1516933.1 dienelactone hydrolase family protein [Alphaproteobacteria bacterium]MBU2095821.1 dienelactone hydrolase family protein [Alphaproteobacteria bacterium]MBU2152042.1 dienelactone hydrolase family protein [Alphaproteobacteria bacterium]MBU2309563.1 dienelactone hydrolase family protein [Alphaproteobacteria bacterium]
MPEARIELELDDGALDAFVACPDTPGRKPPILLLSRPDGLTKAVESRARRLSAHNYFVLAPDLSGLSADDRREAAWACLDHLADERRVDDTRVGALGFGSGGDLALTLAAGRSERIAAVAAYGARGFRARAALEIAHKINGLVRIGYSTHAVPARAGLLETALNLSGVLFDVEVYDAEPHWPDLLDFFARALEAPQGGEAGRGTNTAGHALNP